MRVALYARVSTDDGRQTVDNQLEPLRAWAARLGALVVHEYVDYTSGTVKDRLELVRCLDDAHLRRFDTILIWALDRLSREGIVRMEGYIQRFRAAGVRVMSHQEPWLDTNGPTTDLLLSIFAWIAKQERERLVARTRAGLVHARGKGRHIGRPYRILDDAAIRRELDKGSSLRAVARTVGVPLTTLRRHVHATKLPATRVVEIKPDQSLTVRRGPQP